MGRARMTHPWRLQCLTTHQSNILVVLRMAANIRVAVISLYLLWFSFCCLLFCRTLEEWTRIIQWKARPKRTTQMEPQRRQQQQQLRRQTPPAAMLQPQQGLGGLREAPKSRAPLISLKLKRSPKMSLHLWPTRKRALLAAPVPLALNLLALPVLKVRGTSQWGRPRSPTHLPAGPCLLTWTHTQRERCLLRAPLTLRLRPSRTSGKFPQADMFLNPETTDSAVKCGVLGSVNVFHSSCFWSDLSSGFQCWGALDTSALKSCYNILF